MGAITIARSGWHGLIEELKRRKVFRIAGVYAGVGFVLAQAADIAFPALRLPEWTVTLVVVLLLLGFPLAIILAWAFDITPDGVVRTEVRAPAKGSSGTADGSAGRPSRHRGIGVSNALRERNGKVGRGFRPCKQPERGSWGAWRCRREPEQEGG